mmetsp:Transcript_30828/g.82558  ORF Transcript_30828/g.82558 Transcript_30828/m.82558 type:complete len:248 (+) Transcript_30828:4109-4852(+)
MDPFCRLGLHPLHSRRLCRHSLHGRGGPARPRAALPLHGLGDARPIPWRARPGHLRPRCGQEARPPSDTPRAGGPAGSIQREPHHLVRGARVDERVVVRDVVWARGGRPRALPPGQLTGRGGVVAGGLIGRGVDVGRVAVVDRRRLQHGLGPRPARGLRRRAAVGVERAPSRRGHRVPRSVPGHLARVLGTVRRGRQGDHRHRARGHVGGAARPVRRLPGCRAAAHGVERAGAGRGAAALLCSSLVP